MEYIGIIVTSIALSIVWFLIVLVIAKRLDIKKDAHISKILCCLIVMGPIGWSIILVIWAYDLVDSLITRKNK